MGGSLPETLPILGCVEKSFDHLGVLEVVLLTRLKEKEALTGFT